MDFGPAATPVSNAYTYPNRPEEVPKFNPEIKQEPAVSTYQYNLYEPPPQPPQQYPNQNYQYQYPPKPQEIKTENFHNGYGPPYQNPYQYPPPPPNPTPYHDYYSEFNNRPSYQPPAEVQPPPPDPPKTPPPPPPPPPKRHDGPYLHAGDGGPMKIKLAPGSWCCRQGGTENPTPEHMRDGACAGLQTQDEIIADSSDSEKGPSGKKGEKKGENGEVKKEETTEGKGSSKNNAAVRTEIPECSCFSADKNPPEPGSFYTHLGKLIGFDFQGVKGLNSRSLRPLFWNIKDIFCNVIFLFTPRFIEC